ncbi:VOC family protein [Kitasatospora sp. NBC_01250]|uniref:VOC family protein n=1 Tax=Kitasatospora sp. NBC_01250 TaxID=2903571 RepID=UPI002E324491|nr:VOC family protein [Kitasatospora sp. NBC_01250]
MITALDHLQLTAPPGSEPALRAFYAGALGMTEIPKPPELAGRGGCWFTVDGGRIRLYLGVEGHFRPTTKAHPGLRVADLDACAERLAAHGAPVVWDSSLPPDRRIYCQDPVGNLLEFVGPGGPAGEPVVPGVRGVGTKVKV